MIDYRILILARGGSKRILNKNLCRVGGMTLLERAISTSQQVVPGEVYVSSDNSDILIEATACGATPVQRPLELATDHSTSEEAAIHFLSLYPCDKLILVQCTTPFLQADDICGGIELFDTGHYNSVISATKATGFYWTSAGIPQNFDPDSRKRTQDMETLVRENGGFYIVNSRNILNGARFAHGKVGFVVMSEINSIDIDAPEDLEYARIIEKYIRSCDDSAV